MGLALLLGLLFILCAPVALILALRSGSEIHALRAEVRSLERETRRLATRAEVGVDANVDANVGVDVDDVAEQRAPEASDTRSTEAPVLGEAGELARRPASSRVTSSSVTPGNASTPGEAISERAGDAPTSGDGSAPPPSSETARRRRPQIERWLGVRGAAVAGGLAIALSGLLLYRHAVEQGWITEVRRFAGGVVLGVLALVVGDRLRPRGYRFAPESLAGAGLVTLYAAFWAASERYGLWSQSVSWGAMAATTALACGLALRYRSRIVATFALLGGFATPFVVRLGGERELALFGYALLLDLALLFVAARLRWTWFAVLAALGTGAVQLDWVVGDLDRGGATRTLIYLALFAVLFVLWGERASAADPEDAAKSEHATPSTRAGADAARAVALALPFLFSIALAGDVELTPDLAPLAVLALVLSIGACRCASEPRLVGLPPLASAASFAMVLTWQTSAGTPPPTPLLIGVLLTLAAVPFVALLLAHGRDAQRSTALRRATGAALLGAAAALWTATATPAASTLPAHALVLPLLATMALVAGRGTKEPTLWSSAAALVAAGLLARLLAWGGIQVVHADPLALAGFVGAGAAALLPFVVAAARSKGTSTRRTHGGAGALLAAAAFGLLVTLRARHDWSDAHVALALLPIAGAALWSSARATLAWCTWVAAPLGLIAVVPLAEPGALAPVAAAVLAFLVLLAATAMAPRVDAARARVLFGGAAATAAALVIAATLVATQNFDRGGHVAGCLPIVALLVGWLALDLRRGPTAPRPSRLEFAMVAIAASALAIGGEYGHHEFSVVPALTAAGFALLHRSFGERRALAAAFAGVACAALVIAARVALGDLGEGSSTVVLHHRTLTVLGPAGVALLVAHVSGRRPSGWRDLDRTGPAVAGGIAVVLGLVWISLAVLDVYVPAGELMRVPRDVNHAVHLSLSIAWAVYALALLAIGVRARRPIVGTGARWASLVVLMLALGKVFLFDLGDLEGLRRVGSLAALGLTSITVSLLYQKFVFGRIDADRSGGPTPKTEEAPPSERI